MSCKHMPHLHLAISQKNNFDQSNPEKTHSHKMKYPFLNGNRDT